jgi:cell division protein FtsA
MNQETGEEVLTALDLGATKACVLMGVVREGGLTVIGAGRVPCYGIQKGVIIDIEPTVEAIAAAVREAEKEAGVKAGPVLATVSGQHIKSATSDGSVTVHNRDHGITEDDIHRVMDQAVVHAESTTDHEVLHTIPVVYSVDGQDGIRNPLGMYGNKLIAKVRIITGAVSCVQNVLRCVQMAELVPQGLVLHSLASEKAVLGPEEREMGVVCIDIGGSTTDLAIIIGKSVRHTAVIPIGGDLISKDVSVGLRIPYDIAETVKRSSGSCMVSEVREDENVDIPASGGRQSKAIPRRTLARIIEARVEDIFDGVKAELGVAGFGEGELAGGLVITGGCAHLPFIVAKAEKTFEVLAARVGEPTGMVNSPVTLRMPEYAAAVGLLVEAAEHRRHTPAARRKPSLGGISKMLKDWVRGA